MSSAQMDVILDEGLRAAIEMLEKRGEFYPFAIAMDSGEDIEHLSGFDGSDFPDASQVITFLESSLSESAKIGVCIATGIVSNVELIDDEDGSKHDAIAVAIEDRESEPILCFLPYSLVDGVVHVGDVIAQPGVDTVFAPLD
jgi:hypothetical protein